MRVAGARGDRCRGSLRSTLNRTSWPNSCAYAAGHKVPPSAAAAWTRRRPPATSGRGCRWLGTWGSRLGKYGLVPLTFEEQKEVIARVQYWFPHWCAAPVFYVDHPLVTRTDVYHGPRLAAGHPPLARHGRPPSGPGGADRHGQEVGGPAAALRTPTSDARGFLTAGEIAEAHRLCPRSRSEGSLGGRHHPAAGVRLRKARRLRRLRDQRRGHSRPLGRKAQRRDPFLVGLREPDEHKVARVKLLARGRLSRRPRRG